MIADLLKCVDPETAGNPCSDEKWVRSRLRALSEKLDHRACPTTIGRLLREQKFGQRSHRKVLHTGKPHAERDRQFQHINEQRQDFRSSGDPRISVDTKKRNSSASSRIPAKRGVKKRRRSTITIFPVTRKAGRRPMASTIRNATRGTCA